MALSSPFSRHIPQEKKNIYINIADQKQVYSFDNFDNPHILYHKSHQDLLVENNDKQNVFKKSG